MLLEARQTHEDTMKNNRLAKLLAVRAASKLRIAARRRRNLANVSTIASPPASRANPATSPCHPTTPTPGSLVSPLEFTLVSTQLRGTILALPASPANAANGAGDGANGTAIGAEGIDGGPDGANHPAAVQEYSPDDPLFWEWENSSSIVLASQGAISE
jgi:hypothetical protein